MLFRHFIFFFLILFIFAFQVGTCFLSSCPFNICFAVSLFFFFSLFLTPCPPPPPHPPIPTQPSFLFTQNLCFQTDHPAFCSLSQVSTESDDGSALIRLTALQILGRDLRIMLKKVGSVALHMFGQVYQEHFVVELKPALYGFPDVSSLLRALPHIVKLTGRPGRKFVELSHILSNGNSKKAARVDVPASLLAPFSFLCVCTTSFAPCPFLLPLCVCVQPALPPAPFSFLCAYTASRLEHYCHSGMEIHRSKEEEKMRKKLFHWQNYEGMLKTHPAGVS